MMHWSPIWIGTILYSLKQLVRVTLIRKRPIIIADNKDTGDSRKQHRHVANGKFISSASNRSGFKIAHLNIRSLYHKHNEVMLLLAESKINISCLSKTWLDSTNPDFQIHVPGYTPERKGRNR